MDIEQQQKHFEALSRELSQIMLSKGNDYANDDRLSNFKLVAQICGISPEKVCMVMLATKIVRLGNLTDTGKIPNNESIVDNSKDLTNYGYLFHMIHTERNSNANTHKQNGVDRKIPAHDQNYFDKASRAGAIL